MIRSRISNVKSASVYKSSPLGRITGCSEKCPPDGGQRGMLPAKLTETLSGTLSGTGIPEGNFMGIVNDRLLTELSAKDDLAFKLGDTLDVKASIGLVVITFLGTQTAYLLDKHVTGLAHILQAGSVVALVVATIASIVELWPRNYLMIEPEVNTASRIIELQDHYSQYSEEGDATCLQPGSEATNLAAASSLAAANTGAIEANVLEQLTVNEIAWTLDRISTNQTNNGAKVKWLDWAYKATAASLILNLITLIDVWLTHPF